jgi:hypothetical protein
VRFPLSRAALSTRLKERRLEIKKTSGEWVVIGLDLRDDPDDSEDDF